MKRKLANYVSVIEESWDVVSERGVWSFNWVSEWGRSISVGCLPWSHCIVLSEEPHVVQANFASTPNASAITSTTNTSTITKEHREICRDVHCMRKNRSSWLGQQWEAFKFEIT